MKASRAPTVGYIKSVIVPFWSSIGLSHKAAIRIDRLNKTDLSDKLKNILYSHHNFSHKIVFGNTHTIRSAKLQFRSPSGHKIDVI